jgi:hypothetical protein
MMPESDNARVEVLRIEAETRRLQRELAELHLRSCRLGAESCTLRELRKALAAMTRLASQAGCAKYTLKARRASRTSLTELQYEDVARLLLKVRCEATVPLLDLLGDQATQSDFQPAWEVHAALDEARLHYRHLAESEHPGRPWDSVFNDS